MGQKYQRMNGETMPQFNARIGAIQATERREREALAYRGKRAKRQRTALRNNGHDELGRGDDLGLSPDY